MQKKCNKKLLSLILSMMLIVAMAFSMTACGGNNQEKPNTESQSEVAGTENDVTVLGEGEVVFNFVVVDGDGKETNFEVHTNKTTVGEALLELNLIEGEDSAYGLFVKRVNGITADYDVDGTYWAFFINGEYASTGVDTTDIVAGDRYSFEVK